jgi:uncharacterized delta-60 repeat protein
VTPTTVALAVVRWPADALVRVTPTRSRLWARSSVFPARVGVSMPFRAASAFTVNVVVPTVTVRRLRRAASSARRLTTLVESVRVPAHADGAVAVAIDGQGRIVVAGNAGSPNQIALARYLPDGTLDPSFGGGTGKVAQPVSGNGASAGAVAIQKDGKIVVAGFTEGATGFVVLVARFKDDGTRDTSLNGGIVTSSVAGRDASAVLIQPDDKIVVGATGPSGAQGGMVVARILPNGFFDQTFDGDGVAHVFNDAANCGASDQSGTNDVVLLPNGDLLAGGTCGGGLGGGDPRIGLARFHGGTTGADGALDTTFGTNGAVSDRAEPGQPAFAANLVRQADGMLIEGGASAFGNNGNQQKAVVLRRNEDGSLDSTYAAGGIRLFQFANRDTDVTRLALDSAGRVRAAFTRSVDGGFGLAGLTTDGSLDSAFAPGGLLLVPFGEPAPIMSVSSFPDGMALQPDDKAVEVGESRQNGNSVMTVMRFAPLFDTPSSGAGAGAGGGGGGGTGTGATTPQPLPPGLAGATAGLNGVRISSLRYNGHAITFSLRCPALPDDLPTENGVTTMPPLPKLGSSAAGAADASAGVPTTAVAARAAPMIGFRMRMLSP